MEAARTAPSPVTQPPTPPAKAATASRMPTGSATFFSDDAVPLSLESSKEYGRHLVMKYDVMPSDLILAAEAYAGVNFPSTFGVAVSDRVAFSTVLQFRFDKVW